ncbi:MAG: 30S ribosomal protein THX, partial [Flavobacteriales bacterium]
MGKGDKKSKKGKRLLKTWGVHRPRTDKTSIAPV